MHSISALRHLRIVLTLLGTAILLSGCTTNRRREVAQTHINRQPLKVVTSLQILTEVLRRVGGAQVQVITLVPKELSEVPFRFAPSDRHRDQINAADAVFYVGEVLEHACLPTFQTAKANGKTVICLLDEIPTSDLLLLPEVPGGRDPHIWLDAQLWGKCVMIVAKHLSALRPSDANHFLKRGEALLAEYQAVDGWVKSKALELPEPRRVLVTTLSCMQYFARAYGFKLRTLNLDDAPLRRATEPNRAIQAMGVKAVFDRKYDAPTPLGLMLEKTPGVTVETRFRCYSLPTTAIDASHGSYVDLMRSNMELVVNALK